MIQWYITADLAVNNSPLAVGLPPQKMGIYYSGQMIVDESISSLLDPKIKTLSEAVNTAVGS